MCDEHVAALPPLFSIATALCPALPQCRTHARHMSRPRRPPAQTGEKGRRGGRRGPFVTGMTKSGSYMG